MTNRVIIAALLLPCTAFAAPPPSADSDTKAWWAITSELSGDAMEGRDSGSKGYDRAAQLVADKFKAAGLQPLGENNSWFQPVVMEEIRVERASVKVGKKSLRHLQEFRVNPSGGMPNSLTATLVYRGYCDAATLGDVRDKMVICHATNRAGLPDASQRDAAVVKAGAAGIINISDPGFTVEPPTWPKAYSRLVTLSGPPPATTKILRITFNHAALGKLIGNSGKDSAALISAGSKGDPLPNFDVVDPFTAKFSIERRSITSPNVLAMLPGTDPALADQAIVLSAHLDGYGYGEAFKGDRLYNGTLDNAAYVALLIRLAEQRKGKGFRRPIIFAAFAGEEKGLLGSEWFVAHPTWPKAKIAGNINLDQLRPIFPLDLLTAHALDDSSLGDDARATAEGLGIAVQHDPEPERNLLQRSDHWNFIEAGIPATNFVFGYRTGSTSEQIYRRWYHTGYHRPQDDLKQAIDWKAATVFNRFFYNLVTRVADKDEAPAWKAGSPLKPKP
jgi:hypothetical protein